MCARTSSLRTLAPTPRAPDPAPSDASPPFDPFFRLSSGGLHRPAPISPLTPLNESPIGRGQKLDPITSAFIFMTHRSGAEWTESELGLFGFAVSSGYPTAAQTCNQLMHTDACNMDKTSPNAHHASALSGRGGPSFAVNWLGGGVFLCERGVCMSVQVSPRSLHHSLRTLLFFTHSSPKHVTHLCQKWTAACISEGHLSRGTTEDIWSRKNTDRGTCAHLNLTAQKMDRKIPDFAGTWEMKSSETLKSC
ncbi:hypothetical protein WMY93_030867 [Mugilogobius chulae]|uniref:Uncharacterized protein n=1 Tax=Mugilogobius chulae TaxID=88201 RepID=A0AAW0MIG0_9GOBI